MSNLRHVCWVAGLAASSLLASTCGGSSPTVPATPAVTVKTVSVTGLPGSLVVGQTAQLTATAGFSDNSTKTVSSEASWFSANTVVATVSSSGLVSAVAAGTADIRASYLGVTAGQMATISAPPDSEPGLSCGVERWPVKTLSDADATRVNLGQIQQTTVRDLNLLPAHCNGLPDARTFPPEFQVYEVTGLITIARAEDDRDYHIAIADPDDASFTIVTETADPVCNGVTMSTYKQQLGLARTSFQMLLSGHSLPSLTGALVRVRGVGFYDFAHGQTGRSQSCMELHPILNIERVQ